MLDAINVEVEEDGTTREGFLIRDLLRFIVVDIILILTLRLLLGLGVFNVLDHYVLSVLGSKVILFAYLMWLIRERRDAWPETGGDTAGVWWAWPASLVLYAGCYPFMIWADRLNNHILTTVYPWFGWTYEPTPQEIMNLIFLDIVDSPVRMTLVFFTVFAGPFMEELAFRGVGLDAFRRRMNVAWAVVMTSALFGMFHFSLQTLLPLTLMGAIFAAVRFMSRSLWCSVFIHSMHNALVLAIMGYNLGFWEKLKSL